VGKNSGRLYEITLDEVDIQNAEIPELVTRIAGEIDRLPKAHGNEERKENYRLAKRALRLGQVPLFLALNPSSMKEAI